MHCDRRLGSGGGGSGRQALRSGEKEDETFKTPMVLEGKQCAVQTPGK